MDCFRKVYQDMSHPITDYFISAASPFLSNPKSSFGDVSVLRKLLLMGYRSIHLVIRDGQGGYPVVDTWSIGTSSGIPINEVLDVISEFAFQSSSYPCILCLSNNCSASQTYKVTKALKECFGDALATPCEENIMPSPESLRRKILILEREFSPKSVTNDSKEEQKRTALSDIYCLYSEIKQSKLLFLPTSTSIADNRHLSTSSDDVHFEPRTVNFFDESLYCDIVESNTPVSFPYHKLGIFSIPSHEIPAQHARLFGFQLCPMNFEIKRPGSIQDHVNHGWFANNGGCGYVLKPHWMRGLIEAPEVKSDKSLKITIISGHFIPCHHMSNVRGKSSLSVQVQLLGSPTDEKKLETQYVQESKGLRVRWDKDSTVNNCFVFSKIKRPEMALVYVILRRNDPDKGKRAIAQACVPLSLIRDGLRIIPLCNDKSEPIFGWLFVKIANDFFEKDR